MIFWLWQEEGVRERYGLDHFLVLTRVLHVVAPKKQGSKKKKVEESGEEAECIYLKAEDEVLRQHASAAFEFRMENREEAEGLASYALVMLLPKAAVPEVLSGVAEAVGDEALRNQQALD
jgi:uncharacterized lipoprotein YehR (DUF1307 family)